MSVVAGGAAGGVQAGGGAAEAGSQGLGQAGQVSQSAPAPSPPPPPPSPAPAASPSPSPVAGPGAVEGAQAPAAQQAMGVREALAQYGLDLRQQFTDDHAALAHLALVAQQQQRNAQLAQYGEQYVQHADQFQAWLKQQQAQQAQQQAQQQQWWKAPEYDPAWLQKLTRDPQTGELRVLPGNDPSILPKFLAWREHQQGFLERFSADPIAAIKPGIEQLVRSEAERLVREQLGGYQERTAAETWVQQNSTWLHARDGQGNVVRDPQTGAPALSQLGQAFAGYVRKADQLGLHGVEAQREYALSMTQRDYALSVAQQQQAGQAQQAQQSAAGQQNAAAQQQFLDRAAQQGSGRPAPPPGNVAGSVPGPGSRAALEQAMLAEMQANGFAPGQSLIR